MRSMAMVVPDSNKIRSNVNNNKNGEQLDLPPIFGYFRALQAV